MKKTLLLLASAFLLIKCATVEDIVQDSFNTNEFSAEQPKLIVGITVDQMRYDYITKYWDDFSETGFKRLINNGFFCENHHFSYAPTFTGPGHASIYTGTTPANHGIVANTWYDKYQKRYMYCAEDPSVIGVGDTTNAGMMSPKNMVSNTITDELKLFSNLRSKTIGISIKDRGAILPAGHLADAAYWFIGSNEGKFITSSFYMDELPEWAADFNNSDYADSLLNTGWKLLKDKSVYDESILDNNPYEMPYNGKLQPAFPYDFSTLKDSNGGFDLIKASALGNELITDFALQCLKHESLGTDEHCDFLTVSYSSTDYVGHQFAPTAIETQDTYLRLDKDISKFLSVLDGTVGANNYMVFLTADHGAVHNPNYLKKLGMPSGYFKTDNVMALVDSALSRAFGVSDLVENYSNNQMFISDSVVLAHSLNKVEIETVIANAALYYEGVQMSITREQFLNSGYNSDFNEVLHAGFSQKLSGDVLILPKPGWMSYPTYGTSHGSPYPYDTHTPLIFYGNGIPHGTTDRETHIIDIAPTLAALLGIQMPNACTGSPILEVLGQ